jgi:leader peptidase (prepilin peptidase)/N-methyltransferase
MLEAVLAAVFGLLIGSFLNVCIYRWPNDMSVVRPRSHCPSCERQIAWVDNIPVLSYLLLRGRCRHCRARIPIRYPVVELLTAALFFFFVFRLGLTLAAFKYCLLAAMLIVLIFADIEYRILPDEFTIGGAVAGILLSTVVRTPDTTVSAVLAIMGFSPPARALSVFEAMAGAIVPAGALWLGGWLFEKLRHKEGLGLGDVKMMAMVGAFLGVQGALLTLIVGSLLGSITGIVYIYATGKDWSSYQLPLGTFLGIAAVAVAVEGQRALEWYGSFF